MQNHKPIAQKSRRTFLQQTGTIAAAALLSGCTVMLPPVELSTPALQPESTSTPVPQPTTDPLAAIPLETKIGQMIMVGFAGTKIASNSPLMRDVQLGRIGGVALFDYNIQTFEQTKNLISTLQNGATTPLIVSADQEGGRVQRLGATFGLADNFSAQELGTKDIYATHAFAQAIANVLAEAGINLNLAPVVDLNSNPQNPIIGQLGRSFSADHNVVSQHAYTFIQAHHDAGVQCTLKHFPGHGSSTTNSHTEFVDVTNSWREDELFPFSYIINTGRSDAIMTAHIFNAKLDEEYPATLSKKVLTDTLRQRLNYNGLIITDDMRMGAINDYYGYEKAVELAVLAGVDVIADSWYQADRVEATIRTISNLVQSGQTSARRIEESYARIMRAKSRIPGHASLVQPTGQPNPTATAATMATPTPIPSAMLTPTAAPSANTPIPPETQYYDKLEELTE